MKIAIAQYNATVGDLAGNVEHLFSLAARAREGGAQLLVSPELGLTGYPPEDLLLRPGFYRACRSALERLAEKTRGIAVLVGYPRDDGEGRRYNAAALLMDGEVKAIYDKHILPNHTVFDEERYFDAGTAPCVFLLEGIRFGVAICADIWESEPAEQAATAGAQVLLALNASPFHLNKLPTRHQAIRDRVREECFLAGIYVNLVGGQDELVFDGASFVIDGAGAVCHQLAAFEEDFRLVEIDAGRVAPGELTVQPGLEESIYRAMVVGTRDYVEKNGFGGVVLGLSGGIDSALTLTVAVDALGAERVHAVMMPSRYTAAISREDARQLAGNVGIELLELSVEKAFEAFLDTLKPVFDDRPFDVTEENIQARVRGTLLMALSNKFGWLVLTTGNKSEMAVGYATLYGDMAGGYGVLKDVTKTLVYRLAAYRNRGGEVIPARIIERPPSAELRANQTDQDSLPPYDVLDAIVEAYVEDDLCSQEIVNLGFDEVDVVKVVRLINLSEYKRRQAPIGVRVTHRGFGKDRRYPITSKYRGEEKKI